jgi:hypothetical protein
MKIDIKLAIASFVLLAIGFITMFLDMNYHLNFGLIPGAFMLGYVVLFALFLYYNHEIAKNESPIVKSIREYEYATKIWGILLLAGVIIALTGYSIEMGMLTGIGVNVAGVAFLPAIYCLVGWDDIKRKSKKLERSEVKPSPP